MTDARVSRVTADVLVRPNPDVRVSQIVAEVLYNPKAFLSGAAQGPAVTGAFDVQVSTSQTLALTGQIPDLAGDFALNNPIHASLTTAVPGVGSSLVIQITDHVSLTAEVPGVGSTNSLSVYASEYAEKMLSLGPIAYWRLNERPNLLGSDFDERFPLTMIDVSGGEHHGEVDITNYGWAPYSSTGATGDEATVDGPGYYPLDDKGAGIRIGLDNFVVGHGAWMDLNEFTLIGLIRRGDGLGHFAGARAGRSNASGTGVDDSNEVFSFVWKNTVGQVGLRSRVRNSADSVVEHYMGTMDVDVNAAGWQVVAVTYDGTDVRTYLGKTLVATTALAGPLKTTTRDFQLRSQGSDDARFSYDEWAIYDYAIDQSDIEDLWEISNRDYVTIVQQSPNFTNGAVPRVTSNVSLQTHPAIWQANLAVPRPTANFALQREELVSVTGSAPRPTGAFTVATNPTLSGVAQVPGVAASVALSVLVDTVLVGAVPDVAATPQFFLTLVREITLEATLPAATGEWSVVVEGEASVDGDIPPLTGSLELLEVIEGDLAGSVGNLSGSLGSDTSDEVSLSSSVPGITSTLTIGFSEPVELDGVVSPLTGDLAVLPVLAGVLSGTVAALDGSMAADRATEVIRWTFTDTVTDEVASLILNPNKMSTPTFAREVQFGWTSGFGMAGVDRMQATPTSWTFEGVILSKVHYDRLLEWAKRGVILRVDDHLGRAFGIIIEKYDPIERLPTARREWRADYTMTCLLLEVIE